MQAESMLTILAIRHGETVFNTEKRYQGHCDSRLTETGRKQVSSLARRMEKIEFDTLISSDLGRARETASIIAEHTGHKVETDSRLRERNYGVLEGLTIPEINAGYSEVLERLDANDPDYIIPEGESHRQHYTRNIALIDELQSGQPGARVALVAHGGVLDSLFRYVANLPLDDGTPLRWRDLAEVGEARAAAMLKEVAVGDPHSSDENEDPRAALAEWLGAPKLTNGPGCLQVGFLEDRAVAFVCAQVSPEDGWSRITYLGIVPELREQGGKLYHGGTGTANAGMMRLFHKHGCEEVARMFDYEWRAPATPARQRAGS